MQTMTQSLVDLVQRNLISPEEAMGHATETDEVRTALGQSTRSGGRAEEERDGSLSLAGGLAQGRDAQRGDGSDQPRGGDHPPAHAAHSARSRTQIKEKGKGLDNEISIPTFGAPVKAHDVVIFTRQFATMIDAGLPIVQCLDILAAQTDNKKFRKVISAVKDDVESGTTFADAMRKHPKLFDDLYINMVQAGEIGGILDTILQRLASYLEKAMKLKARSRAP